MRHTHQQPFRFHLRQPAQQKLPKAAHMFDLREDRFDDHFSSAEHCTSSFAPKLVPHPFLQRGVAGQRGLRRSREWLTLIWWHMQIDSPYGLMRKRGLAVVTGIGRSLHRHSSQVAFHLTQHRDQLFLVHARLHYFGRHNDLGLRVYAELNVIGLLEGLARMVFHDARVRISEVAFALRRRHRLARVNYFARRALLALLFCLFLLMLSCSGFFLRRFTCFALHVGLQFTDAGQPRLALTQLWRQLVTALAFAVKRIFLLIYALGFGQQPLYFGRQFLFCFAHRGITHGAPLRSIRFDLGAIDRHVAQLYQASTLTQCQDLHEQFRQFRQMSFAKRRNAVVIWLLVTGQHSKRHVIVSGSLQLARRHAPSAEIGRAHV